MIILRDISLRRGSKLLLQDANVTIQPGQRLAMIGANGCGKSSLFKLLLGELGVDQGELRLPRGLRIAHMAQEVEASPASALDYVIDGDRELRHWQGVLARAEAAEAAGLKPKARILGYAHAGVRPEVMGIGPVPAVQKLLDRTGLSISDFTVIESNEAFAAQAVAVARELGMDPERVNPNGGAIALGHPVGATGAILTIKALYELERTGGRRALVTMCIGGGQGLAAVLERLD